MAQPADMPMLDIVNGARTGLVACLALLATSPAAHAEAPYVPPADNAAWSRVAPGEAGFDPALLQAAMEFAQANENPRPRDLALTGALERAREPYDAIVGPTRERGGPAGLILHGGRVVATWGDVDRVDMTFSLTKSFLSTVVGLAVDRGKIPTVEQRVAQAMPAGIAAKYFSGDHNGAITWDHLLRQTSNWRGTLWDKPDWADRPVGDDPFKWPTLPVPAPGTSWKYNDVRVNLLALAALHIWREPLPDVLEREVMDPIGASETWRWHGYENSWVDMDGKRMQSVSGGGHWGGGMFINAWDQARFGLLLLRQGKWGERRIWSDNWQRYASTPTPQNTKYGVMNWFLNVDPANKELPSAPASAVVHLGNGVNAVYVDPENDLVVVARWIRSDRLDAFIGRVLAARKGS
jgi:CubicO group peptidase (beta-lactamase class C family)